MKNLKNINMAEVYASASNNKQMLRLVCDYIDADKLKDNPENELIYGKLNVDDLVPEIVRSGGVKEPIEVVKKSDGLYIISGHKRKLATLTAFEKGLLSTKKVPYFISSFENEAEEKLALIGRNTQRHKTYLMRLNEVNTITKLLKDSSDAKKGGFRAYVSAYLGISQSELQRYWDFEKLSDTIKNAVENNILRFSVACEFVSLKPEIQDFMFEELCKNNKLETKYIRNLKKSTKEGLSIFQLDEFYNPLEIKKNEKCDVEPKLSNYNVPIEERSDTWLAEKISIDKPNISENIKPNKISSNKKIEPSPKTQIISTTNPNSSDITIKKKAINNCIELLYKHVHKLNSLLDDTSDDEAGLEYIAYLEYLSTLINYCKTDLKGVTNDKA